MDSLQGDEELLNLAKQGCEVSFNELYRRHAGRIFRFARELGGSEAIAQEVTQEVFLALVSEMERFDAHRGSFLPYLLGTARRQTYRLLRRERPYNGLEAPQEIESVPEPGCLVAELTKKETVAALRGAIGELPDAFREVILLCELEEMDYAQAAQVLGCPIGTVRSRLHRARAMLVKSWMALTVEKRYSR